MEPIKGYPPRPDLQHHLEPMFVPVDEEGNVLDLHHCYWCRPEFYAKLAPGYTLCSCCGVVILTGNEDDPYNEAMEICEGCAELFTREFMADPTEASQKALKEWRNGKRTD